MNWTKKCILAILLISLVGLLVVPKTSLAVWWNPTTWFGEIKTDEPTQIRQAPPAESSVPQKSNIEKPAVQKETITKTITIDNPELKRRVDELIKENDLLKQQLNNQSQTLNQVAAKYNDVLEKYNNMVNALPKFQTALEGMIKPIIDNYNACRLALGMVSIPKPYIPPPTYYPPINNRISCTSNTVFGTTYTNCF